MDRRWIIPPPVGVYGAKAMYTLRFDGLFRSFNGGTVSTDSAGFLCYGWLISRQDVLIAQGHGVFARCKDASSNVAEYLALIEGLDAMSDFGLEDEAIKIFGDAKSIIDQMNGSAGVSSESIWPLYLRARQLSRRFINLKWAWTPRKNNKAADWLTRRAMRQIRSDQSSYQAALRAARTQTGNKCRSARLLPLIDLRIFQPASAIGLSAGSFNPLPSLNTTL
jgi:ribonuclease HI